jgi:hydroxypyruvate isomerase
VLTVTYVQRPQRYCCQVKYTEFDMDNGTGPKIIAGVAVVLAIASAAFTFSEYNTAKNLTVQLNAATADAQKLRDQLAAATADAQQAHTQASAEEQMLVKEARPDLPVTMGFRPSFLGNGKVAVMQNISNSEIEVTLDVMSPRYRTYLPQSACHRTPPSAADRKS